MSPTRRQLVAAATAAVAARPALAANETIAVGCVGTGGRCRKLMTSLATIPNVRIAAVCDVYDRNLEEGRKLAAPGATAVRDYRALLDRKDLDAILIGVPDHWHAKMTVDACAAGKDVYVEKPLTHDPSEGPAVVEAQRTHKRVVQVGMQQRSMPHVARAREFLRAGKAGTVVKVHMQWNRNSDRVRRKDYTLDPKTVDWKAFVGPARVQPLDPYRMFNWRWFWDFGGGIFTDLMVHWVDVAHWCLGADRPERAVSLGEAVNAAGVWETPDTVQTVLSYPGGVQMHFEGTFSNANGGAFLAFMGTEGTVYVDRGRFEFVADWNKKGTPESVVLGSGRKGADFYDRPDGELLHLTNWVECVRSRATPAAPAEAGVSAADAAHLANKALRGGGAASWK
jgi:predicted dehydrogenase